MNSNLIVTKHCDWNGWAGKPGDSVPDSLPADVVAALKSKKAVAELGEKKPAKIEAVPENKIQS